MAIIQIADKPTLDNIATNITYIKNNMPSGGGGVSKIAILNTGNRYTGVTFTISNDEFGFTRSVTLSGTKAEVEVPYLGVYDVNATITGSLLVNTSIAVNTAATILYDPEFVEIKSFALCTDDELKAILNAHYADVIDVSDYWSVGDTRLIHLDAMQAPSPRSSNIWTAQNITITILDFDHTDLATPINGHTKAALTLQTREVLNNNASGSSEAGHIYIDGSTGYDTPFANWSDLYMRTYMNDKVYNAFPSEIKSIIKPSKHYRHTSYNTSTSEIVTDNLFLPSYPEIFGTTSFSSYVATSPVEGTQFKHYETTTNRIKYGNNNGVSNGVKQYWWAGSAASYYSSSIGYYWCRIDTNGGVGNASGDYSCALAPAFAM